MIDWSAVWNFVAVLLAVGALAAAVWFSRGGHVTYRAGTGLEDMSRRLDELTLQVVELKLALSHYQVGVATLTAQLIAARLQPEWEVARAMAAVADDEPLVQLYQLITEHFQISEIDELAATAGIPPESYSGEERPARSLSLVQYAARHGRLEELTAACRRKRPRVKWPMFTI